MNEKMRKMCQEMMSKDSNQMDEMMECMPMMKDMCKTMFENSSQEDNCCSSDCCGNSNISKSDNLIPTELTLLFDEWVNQINEEINAYKKENPLIKTEELAEHFKLSEDSINYLIGNNSNKNESETHDSDYEILKIKKTKNYCSLCEDYVSENDTKPIVVLSCEGACLRGEISRKAANILCHTLLPEKTVRLCLGSALTKEGGQRSLVKSAKKLIALEGCPVNCGSRMISGLSFDVRPEVIRTDTLAEFDTSLFGINELSEEETNKQALLVAKQIAKSL